MSLGELGKDVFKYSLFLFLIFNEVNDVDLLFVLICNIVGKSLKNMQDAHWWTSKLLLLSIFISIIFTCVESEMLFCWIIFEVG
jgi:hypothetical protein